MRRIAVAAMSTISGLVLLFSYHTSTNQASAGEAAGTQGQAAAEPQADATTPAADSTDPATTDDGTDDQSDDSGSTGSSSGSSGSSSGTMKSGTYTGDTVGTRWGDVQVRITVKQGKITKSEAITYPYDNHRDIELNDYALPILADEVVAAQSAKIDIVSGATVTSDGYTQSLQSAIDQAFG
jgi:uncharacterized protein with FMN-binding domain